MFAIVKRSFSTSTLKFVNFGRQNIKSTVKVDYLKFTPEECSTINAPILLYHGLYTSKDLWTPVAGLIANATKRQIFSVDLRNHGGSERTTIDGTSVPLMALDMKQFMAEQNISKGVMFGHSLGGRAMMQMALNYSEMVDKLIVFDMGFNIPTKPLSYLYYVDYLLLQFIKNVGPNLKVEDARDQLKQLLSPKLKDSYLLQILSNSLEKVNGKLQYSFNIEVMYEMLWKGKGHHLDVPNPYSGQCLFIYSNAGLVVEEDLIPIRIVFPNVKFVHINTGHYAMAENPALFSKVITDFINGA